MTNIELIQLLEADMIGDIKDINIENEELITLEIVYQWYLEAEKLIRVLANILSVPMFQAINQLRYAGHHILKAKVKGGEQGNITEAYKHCKRAVYDALDFYVYKVSENYRVLLPALSTKDSKEVESLLKHHIAQINTCRLECGARLEYYSGVQNILIDGLNLIEKINIIQRNSGIHNSIFQEKEKLIDTISKLKEKNKVLQEENVALVNK